MNKQQFLKKLSEIIPSDAELCGFFAEFEDPTYASKNSEMDGKPVRTLTSNQNMTVKLEFKCAYKFDTFNIIKREFKSPC